MAPQQQLEWEQRSGRTAGIAAVAAGVLLLLGTFYPVLAGTRPDSVRAFATLLQLHKHPAEVIIPTILQVLALPLAAYALVYLYRATKARRPETFRAAYVLAIAGPVVVAVALAVRGVALSDIASKAVDSGIPNGVTNPSGGIADLVGTWTAGERRASELTTGSGLYVATEIMIYAGRLAYAFAFIILGLNAMRAGLLSRFMGILGIIAGVLAFLLRGSPVESFWLIAVGVLFMDRWPGGRGPAWATGEADRWPTPADRQRQLMEERGVAPEAETAAERDTESGDGDEDPTGTPHPVSKKRKRKRRR
jgi:hypothetical protein